ncbi:Cytochrome b5-like Heme/Steroid binding domain containing protein [Novymonas esmeraldas]|uniref:Cytochrome b5-like Heme/Steroid binding domain containing protein n=1 Tax=Novymonas esmeraldas TaxID=1808958 RepID=A0AAW0FA10_9TRYP
MRVAASLAGLVLASVSAAQATSPLSARTPAPLAAPHAALAAAAVLLLFTVLAVATAVRELRRRSSLVPLPAAEDDAVKSVAVVVGSGGLTTTADRYTRAEVAKHKSAADCWIVVHNLVLDVSQYIPLHPGGSRIILRCAGGDATKSFDRVHDLDIIDEYAPETIIGVLSD